MSAVSLEVVFGLGVLRRLRRLRLKITAFKIPDQLPLRRRGAASGASSVKAKKNSVLLYSDNPLYLYETPPDDTCGESLLTATSTNNSSFDKMNAAPLSGDATTSSSSSSSTYGDILSAVLHCQHTMVSSLASYNNSVHQTTDQEPKEPI